MGSVLHKCARLFWLFTLRLHTLADQKAAFCERVSGDFSGMPNLSRVEWDSVRPSTLSWESWVAQWRLPLQAAAARSMMFLILIDLLVKRSELGGLIHWVHVNSQTTCNLLYFFTLFFSCTTVRSTVSSTAAKNWCGLYSVCHHTRGSPVL